MYMHIYIDRFSLLFIKTKVLHSEHLITVVVKLFKKLGNNTNTLFAYAPSVHMYSYMYVCMYVCMYTSASTASVFAYLYYLF